MTEGIFALVGFGLAFLAQWWRDREHRARAVADRLHDERREAYTALLVSANGCGQLLGSVALRHGYGAPGGPEVRQQAAYAVDRDFTPRFWKVELVGTPKAVDAAAEMRRRLLHFRDRMTRDEGPPPDYESPEYEQAYEPFQNARDNFIAVARSDLKKTDAGTDD